MLGVRIALTNSIKSWLGEAVEAEDVEGIKQLADLLQAGKALDDALNLFNDKLLEVDPNIRHQYQVWDDVGSINPTKPGVVRKVTRAKAASNSPGATPNGAQGPVTESPRATRERVRLEKNTLVADIYKSGVRDVDGIIVEALRRGQILTVNEVAGRLALLKNAEGGTKKEKKRKLSLRGIVRDLVGEKGKTDRTEVLTEVRDVFGRNGQTFKERTFDQYFHRAMAEKRRNKARWWLG